MNLARKRRARELEPIYAAIPTSVSDLLGNDVDLCPRNYWSTFINPEKRGRISYPIGQLRRPFTLNRERDTDGSLLRRRSLLGGTLIHAITLFCLSYLRTHMPAGVIHVFRAFIHFEKYLVTEYRWGEAGSYGFYASHFNAEILDSYNRWIRDHVPEDGKYISYIKEFYRFGVQNKYPGFTKRVLKQLRAIRVKKTLQGAIARFMDPRKGALNWEEQHQVQTALDDAVGRPRDRAAVGIFYQTGIRPEGVIRLRRKHLQLTPAGDNYFLFVPKVKQRTVTNDLDEYTIERWLGDLLLSLDRPEGGPDSFIFWWLSDVKPTQDLRESLRRWALDAKLLTLRLGDEPQPLPLAPLRFRRTIASILAAQGASPEVIAEMLGDKTTAMALVYTNNSPSIVDILEETLERHPAYYKVLHIFLGRVEVQEDSSLPIVLGGAPHLIDFEKYAERMDRFGHLGRCGNPRKCTLAPPLSCYTCEHFRITPSIRVHEIQLEQIKQEINDSLGKESDRTAGVFILDMTAILTAIAKLRDEAGLKSWRSDRGMRREATIAKTPIRKLKS